MAFWKVFYILGSEVGHILGKKRWINFFSKIGHSSETDFS